MPPRPAHPLRSLLLCLGLVIAAFALAGPEIASSPAARAFACSGAGVSGGTPAAGSAGRAPGDYRIVVRSGRRARTVLVHVPPHPRYPAATLIAFHGGGQSATSFAADTQLAPAADARGVVVAFPDATGPNKLWNVGPTHGGPIADDVAFVDTLMTVLQRGGCSDPARTSLTGLSNGGGLAARVACTRSMRVAAVITVAATYGSIPPCVPARPISVLAIHGTDDVHAPYAGRAADGYRGSVSRWLGIWVGRDGCQPKAGSRPLGSGAVRFDWHGCRPGLAVAHVRLDGGRHEWPGGRDAQSDGIRSPISASAEAVRFAGSQRLP
jgi:polyhydroxybutyrate depolymerase